LSGFNGLHFYGGNHLFIVSLHAFTYVILYACVRCMLTLFIWKMEFLETFHFLLLSSSRSASEAQVTKPNLILTLSSMQYCLNVTSTVEQWRNDAQRMWSVTANRYRGKIDVWTSFTFTVSEAIIRSVKYNTDSVIVMVAVHFWSHVMPKRSTHYITARNGRVHGDWDNP